MQPAVAVAVLRPDIEVTARAAVPCRDVHDITQQRLRPGFIPDDPITFRRQRGQ